MVDYNKLVFAQCGVMAGALGALLSVWDLLSVVQLANELGGEFPWSPCGWVVVKFLVCCTFAGGCSALGDWFRRQN